MPMLLAFQIHMTRHQQVCDTHGLVEQIGTVSLICRRVSCGIRIEKYKITAVATYETVYVITKTSI